MRQTAEAALAAAVEGAAAADGAGGAGAALQPYFVGNAPAAHAELADGSGTLFFHRRVVCECRVAG